MEAEEVIDWKAAAKRYRSQLRAEISGSRKLYLALVEATKRRIAAEPRRTVFKTAVQPVRHREHWKPCEVLELSRLILKDGEVKPYMLAPHERDSRKMSPEIVSQYAEKYGRTIHAIRWVETQILTGHVIGGDGRRKNRLQRQIDRARALLELERSICEEE